MSADPSGTQDPFALLRAFLDPLEDGAIELAADGCVGAWSEGAVRLLGYEPREAIGRPLAALFGAPAAQDMRQVHGVCRSAELRHRSGVPVAVRWVSAPSASAGGVSVLLRTAGERARLARRLEQQAARLETATSELRATEDRFVKSFHGNPAGLAITRVHDGLIIDCNEAFAAILGFTRAELVGRFVHELQVLVPEERARLIEDLRAHGTQRAREIQMRDRSGRPLSVLAAVDMIEIERESCLLTMAVDQTERREAERALRFHESVLRETGEMAKVGGWHFDVQTGAGFWTEEVARIHEVDPADPIWRERGLSFYHGQDRERITRAVQAAIERAEPYDLELQIDTALGNRRWVRTIGRPVIEAERVVRLRGSLQDVTERKLIELRLRALHEVSRVLFESASLTLAAPRVMQLLCERQEWSGALLWQRAQADAPWRVTHVWPSGLPLPAAASELLECACRTGQPCQPAAAVAAGEVCAVPLTAAGEVAGVLQFFAPELRPLPPAELEALAAAGRQLGSFTRQRQAEQALSRMNAELEQRVEERTAQLYASNRELEAFSYSVSHDLRAPLRTVGGFAQALHEDFGEQLPPEAQRYLDAIRHGARQMSQLIEDLLTLSRLNRVPLQRRAVSMRNLVDSVLQELAGSHAGRTVHVQLDALPDCQGEPALLKQVWLNLLSNAFKYTRPRAEAHVTIGFDHAAEHAYYVRDDGTGFDPRYAHKLFGVFERLHTASEFEGTGVGLAIVQRIVHRHGGKVWAEGALDRGACFYFTLPDS